jgi:GNAT superfamily N-acetyltransferase
VADVVRHFDGTTPLLEVVRQEGVTSKLVGYTELRLPLAQPWLADQGDTGVDPAHRGLGLGRWLKAAKALRLLDERPEVRAVETWNAGGNEPMLAINRAVGLGPACRWQRWGAQDLTGPTLGRKSAGIPRSVCHFS